MLFRMTYRIAHLEGVPRGGMKVLSPKPFEFYDLQTYADQTILIGQNNEHEKFNHEGQFATELCRNFILRVIKRRTCIFDTSGIGDTRDLEQENRNLQRTSSDISQYDQAVAICIALPCRLGIKEFLHHSHLNSRDHLIFLFINAPTTNYFSGATIECGMK